ncbi:MAG TPA: SusD/RagB family nutrient-binding outer membrane lipoprotein, partial [Chitinophagaceae bacterium]|nr:SusD/RagB family nutrient-binding outer membrane lipoprotein [Chitinophagaceae bacterium]
NGVVNSMYRAPWSQVQRWNQFSCCNYNYYGTQEYNWGAVSLSFTTLKNVVRMEEEAKNQGLPDLNPYSALGKFFRAFFFYEMTMLVGDLPMKEALKSTADYTPVYDSQKDIFKQVLTWLDEANNDLKQLITAGDNNLTGDIYYGNSLTKWRKAVNAFRLRVLIALSKKDADADLQVKQKFAAVLNDGSSYPLLTGNADNMLYNFNAQFNKYPVNPDNYGFDATRYNMSATHLNTLASLNDPRTFYVAEPAGKKVKDGISPTSYAAFVGASSSQDLADMSTKAGTDNGAGFLPGEYSFYNRKRFYTGYTAEPCIQIGYSEMCFNIAEAINRGWVTGNSETWYQSGIQSVHSFYGIQNGNNTVYFFKAGGSPLNAADYNSYTINFDWDTYYAQPTVQYAGNTGAGLNQILTQKYLAFFQNSGWEAYFNWRRTGVPTFAQGGPGTGNSGAIPKRFQYPGSERTTNGTNLTAALQSQYGGNDNINALMWVIN